MKTILILLTILAISCTPVRRSYFKTDPNEVEENYDLTNEEMSEDEEAENDNVDIQDDEYQPQNIFSDTPIKRSDIYYPDSDTLIDGSNSNYYQPQGNGQFSQYSDDDTEIFSETIILSDNANPDKFDIVSDYEKALKLFDMANYTAAEKKLKALSETLKENDTLVHETKFYIAECHIAKNEFTEATEILKNLDKNVDKNSEITQKTLVRLGQIYCVLGMNKVAEDYFKKLKGNYPNSVYNKLAKCN